MGGEGRGGERRGGEGVLILSRLYSSALQLVNCANYKNVKAVREWEVGVGGGSQCSLYALLGGCCTPYCANIPPISVSEAAALPIRMMACKADLYSITKQLYTCKYTAISCTIVTLAEYRGWIPD